MQPCHEVREVRHDTRQAEAAGRVHVTGHTRDVSEPARCPSCGATVRGGQPWCTQCWTGLREPEDRPVPATAPALPGPRPEGATGGTPVGRGWPCGACGDLNDLARDRCAVCGAPFLAAGEGRPALVLPGVGDVLALGRAQRLLLAAAVAVGASVLLVLVLTVVGSVL